MKKKPLILPLLILGTVLSVSGCASMQAEPQTTAGTARLFQTLHSSCPEAGVALKEGNYRKLQNTLSQEMQEQISEKAFSEMHKNLLKNGDIESVEFVTTFSGEVLDSEIWKIRLAKKDEQGKTKITEKILRLITGKLDGRRKIMGLMIQ